MMTADATNLVERNQQAIVAELGRLRAALTAPAGAGCRPESPSPAPILDAMARRFDFSPFERDVLLLCAGVELDASFATAVTAAGGATFGVALAALDEPHWSALRPGGPLRRWRLIEVGEGATLAASPLRIDEAILHVLVGLPHEDERLRGVVVATATGEFGSCATGGPFGFAQDMLPGPTRANGGRSSSKPTPSDARTGGCAHPWHTHAWRHRAGAPNVFPSQQPAIEGLAAHWRHGGAALAQVVGPDGEGVRVVATAAAARLGRGAVLVCVDPGAARIDREATAVLVARHALLTDSIVLVDLHDVDTCDKSDMTKALASAEAIADLGVACAVLLRDPTPAGRRGAVRLDVPRPTPGEERTRWVDVLGPVAERLDGALDRLTSQFRLGVLGLRGAAEEVAMTAAARGAALDDLAGALWDACRRQSRGALDDLAPRDAGIVRWDDLVLPEDTLRALRELAAHARHQATVLDRWGFASRSGRGLGVTALFAGPSGTGKTLAAEAIADELRLDCHRVDLSAVVSKYIGETEKNLRRVFDAAEAGGAVLVFDEADALFGKRSEVRDSHDRYANIEVSYLLQRMERYRGVAILTTNNRAALDTAFLRRLRFAVQFPFPEAAERAQIWRRALPAAMPRDGLDETKLARLAVTGGNIANIALAAAYLAAEERSPVTMRHLAAAARRECEKIERPLQEAEIGGWT